MIQLPKAASLGIAAAAAIAAATAVQPAEAVEVQWFGHSALKITSPGGKVILIDPFITGNPKTPEEHKDLSKLAEVDLILVTHGHGDHVGDTAKLAEMTGSKVAMNADLGHAFRLAGLVPAEQLIRFNKSGAIEPLEGITVTMVPADHSSELLHDDKLYPGGEPAGYVIELEDGRSLYHAGDTGVFQDMAFIAEFYRPDVAFLPIGGQFTMGPKEAAHAVKSLLRTKTVVPIHFGTFPPLKGTPEEFVEALGDYEGEVVVMSPGESRTF